MCKFQLVCKGFLRQLQCYSSMPLSNINHVFFLIHRISGLLVHIISHLSLCNFRIIFGFFFSSTNLFLCNFRIILFFSHPHICFYLISGSIIVLLYIIPHMFLFTLVKLLSLVFLCNSTWFHICFYVTSLCTYYLTHINNKKNQLIIS